jgi:hypothetical protein
LAVIAMVSVRKVRKKKGCRQRLIWKSESLLAITDSDASSPSQDLNTIYSLDLRE